MNGAKVCYPKGGFAQGINWLLLQSLHNVKPTLARALVLITNTALMIGHYNTNSK